MPLHPWQGLLLALIMTVPALAQTAPVKPIRRVRPLVIEQFNPRLRLDAARLPQVPPAMHPRVARPGRDLDNPSDMAGLPQDPLTHAPLNCSAAAVRRTQKGFACEGGLIAGNQFLCVPYKGTEFPEVVELRIVLNDPSEPEICTGTLVSDDWVLTAAHCLLGRRSAEQVAGRVGADVDMALDPARGEVTVFAFNAVELPASQKSQVADRAVVSHFYSGFGGGEPAGDAALVHLPAAFPSTRIQPARIAPARSFDAVSTLAGFGYSNVGDPNSNIFRVGWPPRLAAAGDEFVFDVSSYASYFCQGDSGGPVFAGFNRGCKPGDEAAETRPRVVEGVVSHFDRSADPLAPAGTEIDQCSSAAAMRLQSITQTKLHAWLCGILGPETASCL